MTEDELQEITAAYADESDWDRYADRHFRDIPRLITAVREASTQRDQLGDRAIAYVQQRDEAREEARADRAERDVLQEKYDTTLAERYAARADAATGRAFIAAWVNDALHDGGDAGWWCCACNEMGPDPSEGEVGQQEGIHHRATCRYLAARAWLAATAPSEEGAHGQ